MAANRQEVSDLLIDILSLFVSDNDVCMPSIWCTHLHLNHDNKGVTQA